MAELLLNNIISYVYLHRTIVDIIGLFLLFSIFLVPAKKVILKRKNPDVGTNIGQQVEKQVAVESVLESHVGKHAKSDFISESKGTPEELPSNSIMTYDRNNIEHLLNELKRIDTAVSFNLAKWKEKHSKSADDFMGLYISENEVNAILQTPRELTAESDPVEEKLQTISSDIKKEIEKQKSVRLQNLRDLFQLEAFEVDALLICLIPELDMQYEKMYSYLQNDVTKKRPTVDLVINLLCKSTEEKLMSRKYFSPASTLIKNHLLYLNEDAQDGRIPLLSRSIKVDERIINYLLGGNEIDHRIQNFSLLIEPEKSLKDLIIAEKERNILIELIKRSSSMKAPIFFFHGAYGTGKKMTAEAMCNELKKPFLVVDSRVLIKDESLEKLNIIIREALLQNSPLFIQGFDALLEKDAGINVGSLIQELDTYQNWVFLSGEFPWMPAGILKNHSFIDHAFPLPSFEYRKQLWESLLVGNIKDLDLDALSSKFSFSGGQIRDAIFIARNIAMVKTGKYELSMEDLYQGCKAQSNKNLSSLAKNITPRYTWNDIVLPKDLREQLKEVSGHIKHKGKVYADWGFDNKLSLGKGLNVLFSGPSGAGKTMAAEILAHEAGLDMYKIDLSTLVSKYIGQTEKNLSKIFHEAQTSNAILFFDEADALFGKRSEVKDSHDRYANIEINYLLQKMEEYEGIVILASNFKSNIDEAFLRRIHFVIEFPLPDDNLREKIWRQIFPKETPLNKDVDYSFLSKFKITGGNIKNIALNAAFLAAEDQGDVKMEHIIRATKREFQKLGKLCTSADFGGYYNLVK
ncbi:MAG: ATP-binding protein [Candidatus Methanoperedens sp.]|nr:ATP-binding protein [Candidatus Methanoperedens sp.]